MGAIKKWISEIINNCFEYGKIGNGAHARRNKITRKVDVRIAEKGVRHKEDLFYRCGEGWEKTFNIE